MATKTEEQTPAPVASDTITVKALDNIMHNGTLFAVDATITDSPANLAPLLETGKAEIAK